MNANENEHKPNVLFILDPRIKVGGLAWLTLWMSISDWRGLFISTIGIVCILILTSSPFKLYRSTMIAFFWISIFYLLAQGWVITGGFAFWRGYWSLEGLRSAGYMVWRIGLIFFLTRLFMEITPPLEQSRGIAFFMRPITKISKIGADISLLITLTLRFIPLLIEEGKAIWLARWLKGQWPKSYINKIKEIARIIPAMIILSIRRAEEVAENLIARGYTSGNYRLITYDNWKFADTLALVILGLWALCILVLNSFY